MNQLQALFEQLRNLDPNDPGRWPLGVRIGTAVLLFLVAAAGGLPEDVVRCAQQECRPVNAPSVAYIYVACIVSIIDLEIPRCQI